MNEVTRDYIETLSGRRVFLPYPDVDSFDLGDISIALSRAPRFTGHTIIPYTVMEHSLAVAALLVLKSRPTCEIAQGLFHDSPEAYLCDIPTPFKKLLVNYKELEEQLWNGICERFHIQKQMFESVKWADRIMLIAEKRLLKPKTSKWPMEENLSPEDNDAIGLGMKITMEIIESDATPDDFANAYMDFLTS